MIAARTLMASAAILAAGCGPAIRPEVRYVALGDSITGALESDTWPRFLIDLLNLADGMFVAEGAGGRTVAGGLQRLSNILDHATYPNANVLIYFLGGADVIDFVASIDPALTAAPSDEQFRFGDKLEHFLDEVRAAMRATLERADAAGFEIYVATYFSLPAGVSPCAALGGDALDSAQAQRVNEYVELLNEVLIALAGEFSAAVVDLRRDSSALAGPPALFVDCTHPSARGSEIIAARFAEALLAN